VVERFQNNSPRQRDIVHQVHRQKNPTLDRKNVLGERKESQKNKGTKV